MTGSQLPAIDAQLVDIRATIDRLEVIERSDRSAGLPNGERQPVDRALAAALITLTADEAMHSALSRFTPAADRRPTRVADVLITLRLLEQALQHAR